ncbi:MAG: hypothetical protein HY721_10505 [Planctomycetes bacterium]|nr:hypothetical protein [Planctomycetota bacterium]
MSELPVQRFLLEVIAVLDDLRIPYMILGGFAVRTWGVPRPTYDADIAVAVDDVRLASLLETLEKAGFGVSDEYRKGWVDTVAGMGKVKVTRFEGTTVWDVDVFLARGAFLETALARRRAARFAGRDAWFLAPEDLILLKLVANRRKDQLDVEEILKITRELDLKHLRTWATRLGVAERLEEFLRVR